MRKAVESGMIPKRAKAIKEQISFIDQVDLSLFVSEPIAEVAVWPLLADTWMKGIENGKC